MYIESVPNRGSPPAILLRESFRADGRVRKRTLANLSAWPTALVEGFRTLLKGGVAVAADQVRIRRALPHGHAVAVLGTLRAIGLDRLLGQPADKRLAPLAMALIASRLIAPASKLATARELAVATAGSSLGRLLRLGAVDEVELYRALDWLGARQSAIETALARRHLKEGALVPSVEGKALAAERVVGAYKDLAHVERAFRSLKTVDLHLRPIHHWLAPRVRAHVFLCMLACHVEWYMRERLRPMLFDDDDPTAAARARASIVAPAQPSPAALRKRASKVTADGGPLHSFHSLLRDLATCTLNEMTTTLNDAYSFTVVATPTPIQARAFSLLAVDPTKL